MFYISLGLQKSYHNSRDTLSALKWCVLESRFPEFLKNSDSGPSTQTSSSSGCVMGCTIRMACPLFFVLFYILLSCSFRCKAGSEKVYHKVLSHHYWPRKGTRETPQGRQGAVLWLLLVLMFWGRRFSLMLPSPSSCPFLSFPFYLPFSPFFSKLLIREEMIHSKWSWCTKYLTWPNGWILECCIEWRFGKTNNKQTH